jgi:hypothetical protein
MSGLKDGAVIAVGELSPQRKNKPQEVVTSRNLRKEETVIYQ